MKKINVIDVMFAEKTGVQDLYETIEECIETNRKDIKDIDWIFNDADVIGAVFSGDNDFIQVYNDDKYEIVDE